MIILILSYCLRAIGTMLWATTGHGALLAVVSMLVNVGSVIYLLTTMKDD
jgi:hypothetical protein